MANKSKRRENRKKRSTKKHRRSVRRGGFFFGPNPQEVAKKPDGIEEPSSVVPSGVDKLFIDRKVNDSSMDSSVVQNTGATRDTSATSALGQEQEQIREPEPVSAEEKKEDKPWWKLWGGKESKKRKREHKRKSECKRK